MNDTTFASPVEVLAAGVAVGTRFSGFVQVGIHGKQYELMKILIYTHPFAPSVGGVENYVMFLAQGLSVVVDSASVEFAVITPTPAGGFDDSQLPYRVIRRPTMRTLVSQIRKTDIFHLVGPCLLPLFIAWFFNKPVVIEHHGYPPVCPNGLLFFEPTKTICPGHFAAKSYGQCLRCNTTNSGWFNSLKMLFLTFPRRWLCQRVAANIAITSHVQERLKLSRTQVIYYGIPEVCPGLVSHTLIGQNKRPICFAYVGRLVSLKGLSLILEAAKNLQMAGYDFSLKFVGDGPERGELEWITKELGLTKHVEFTGFITGSILQTMLNDVDAVLMPSIWEETAGLAAIEQMMRGKLVIASDIGGLGEVVNGSGILFPAGDKEALAKCMKAVLDQPEIIKSKGDSARRRAVDCFSQHRMVKEHLDLYSKLAEAVVSTKGA